MFCHQFLLLLYTIYSTINTFIFSIYTMIKTSTEKRCHENHLQLRKRYLIQTGIIYFYK